MGAAAAALSIAAAAGAASAQSTSVFTGFEAGEDSYTLYAGAVTAFNRDINSSGGVLRFSAAYGEYEYDTTSVAGGTVDIEGVSTDLMIGYQWVSDSSVTAVYFGADYRDNSLSPEDPSNSTSGDETGAKLQVEAFATGSSFSGSSVIASYSTAYETYFVRGRLGFGMGNLSAGPELAFLGNEEYDGYKAGLFVGGIALGDSTNMSVNAGYSESDGSGSGDSVYVGMSLSFQF